MEAVNEDTIISEILDGDSELFSVLVRRYQKPIYNLMLRLTSSAEDALDLSQEAFLKAYKNLHTFRPGGRFFSWLYAIALNQGRDFLRKKRGLAVPIDEAAEFEPDLAVDPDQEREALKKVESAQVHRALMQLPDLYREALILRYQEELSLRETAEALGLTVSGAKMRIHRGLAGMRRLLKEESDESRQKIKIAK